MSVKFLFNVFEFFFYFFQGMSFSDLLQQLFSGMKENNKEPEKENQKRYIRPLEEESYYPVYAIKNVKSDCTHL